MDGRFVTTLLTWFVATQKKGNYSVSTGVYNNVDIRRIVVHAVKYDVTPTSLSVTSSELHVLTLLQVRTWYVERQTAVFEFGYVELCWRLLRHQTIWVCQGLVLYNWILLRIGFCCLCTCCGSYQCVVCVYYDFPFQL